MRCDILCIMRSRLQVRLAALVLAICLVCPLIELFDQWDHTVQTGNDTEYIFVALALCVGASFILAHTVFRMSRTSESKVAAVADAFLPGFCRGLFNLIANTLISASPPITALRI